MMDALQLLLKGVVVVFVVSSMLSIGLAARIAEIVAPLVVLMLAPLLLGMAGQRFAPEAGAKLLPAVTRTSNIGFVAVVILICGANFTALTEVLGSGAIGAAILFIVLLFAGGWALVESKPVWRRSLGYATAGRNVGAGLVTARGECRRAQGCRHADCDGSGRTGIAAGGRHLGSRRVGTG